LEQGKVAHGWAPHSVIRVWDGVIGLEELLTRCRPGRGHPSTSLLTAPFRRNHGITRHGVTAKGSGNGFAPRRALEPVGTDDGCPKHQPASVRRSRRNSASTICRSSIARLGNRIAREILESRRGSENSGCSVEPDINHLLRLPYVVKRRTWKGDRT
jgi:hypothetical protein